MVLKILPQREDKVLRGRNIPAQKDRSLYSQNKSQF